MFVSKEVDYGLRALIVIASHPDLSLTVKDVATRFNIPHNFIALLLPKLMRAGFVAKEKIEKKECLRLVRSASKISLRDVVVAINGPLELVAFGKTDDAVFQPVLAMWDSLEKTIEDYLSKETLEKFLFQPETQ